MHQLESQPQSETLVANLLEGDGNCGDCGETLLADCDQPAEPAIGPLGGRTDDGSRSPAVLDEATAAEVDKYIKQFTSAKFMDRQEAWTALAALGPQALPQLDRALDSGDAEVSSRARSLIDARVRRYSEGFQRDGKFSLAEWKQVMDKNATATESTGIPGAENFPDAVMRFADLSTAERQAQIAELKMLKALVDNGNYGEKLQGRGELSKSYATQIEGLSAGPQLLCEITAVDLSGSKVQDGKLLALAKLPKLTELQLSYTKELSDAGMPALAGLSKLTTLELRAAQISDAGIASLKELTNLENLLLGMTDITDGGMKHLSGMTRLKNVDLDATAVTSEGLKHLAGASNLESLDLANCHGIDDAAVEQLKSYSKLKELRLTDTGISQEGYEQLRRALPNCTITWSQATEGSPWISPGALFR